MTPTTKRERPSTPVRAERDRPRSEPSNVGPEPLSRLHRAVGNQAIQALSDGNVVQAKLAVTSPRDEYEREADRVAETVVRTRVGPRGRERADADERTGRLCPRCRDRLREGKRLHCPECASALADSTGTIAASSGERAPVAAERAVRSLRRGGQSLPDSVRSFFEPRFGRDFGAVRIHTGETADRVARTLNATAFTAGTDIGFRRGAYRPASREGKRLLAHELTHVVQQTDARGRNGTVPANRRDGGATAERADPGGEASTSRRRPPETSGAPLSIQRECYRPGHVDAVGGCTALSGNVTDVGRSSEELFRFRVNCDDFQPGELERLRSFADRLSHPVTIHGFASEEGPAEFNERLSCLRARKARSVLEAAGVGAAGISGVYEHGPTPGSREDRRSVVVHQERPARTSTPEPEPVPSPPRPTRRQPTIGPAPPDRRPPAERTCFGISCDAFGHLREAVRRELTPTERSVREAIEMEKRFLRRTEFRDDYRRMLPETLLYQPIDGWGPELQKKTATLERRVERRARERIFQFLLDTDPTFGIGAEQGLRDLVNSDYAR